MGKRVVTDRLIPTDKPAHSHLSEGPAHVPSRVYTASFSSFAGRKAIFLLALILMASPVAGLRPIRAARFRTWGMPRPVGRILSPFLRCRVASVTKSPSTASACFFAMSWLSASAAARCLSVTVAWAAAFAGAAFAEAAAFLAAGAAFLAGGMTISLDYRSKATLLALLGFEQRRHARPAPSRRLFKHTGGPVRAVTIERSVR